MQPLKPILPLLCATGLLIGAALASRSFAGETAEVTSEPASQAGAIETQQPLAPPSGNDAAVYRMDQPDQNQVEPPGLQEYLGESEEISLYGIDLRIEHRKAEKDIQGLLVVDIEPGSAGAFAGLHPYRQPTRDILSGVGMLAAMAFPPAAVVVPIMQSVPLNEAYDLIIGVDGSRVTNFMDFYYCMREAQPGEVVYLNLLRNGHRVQVPLRITSSLPPPQAWVR
jgi:hypothetical protein